MPEVSLANNEDAMAITFFLFLDGLNNTLTNLLYFLGVECTLTSTRRQICTSSSHTSAMCWIPYAAQKRLFPLLHFVIFSFHHLAIYLLIRQVLCCRWRVAIDFRLRKSWPRFGLWSIRPHQQFKAYGIVVPMGGYNCRIFSSQFEVC